MALGVVLVVPSNQVASWIPTGQNIGPDIGADVGSCFSPCDFHTAHIHSQETSSSGALESEISFHVLHQP